VRCGTSFGEKKVKPTSHFNRTKEEGMLPGVVLDVGGEGGSFVSRVGGKCFMGLPRGRNRDPP